MLNLISIYYRSSASLKMCDSSIAGSCDIHEVFKSSLAASEVLNYEFYKVVYKVLGYVLDLEFILESELNFESSSWFLLNTTFLSL